MSNVQFILDEDKTPIYAIVPYGDYLKLLEEGSPGDLAAGPTLLSKDSLQIRLPYGGEASIDLVRLVDYCEHYAISSIAINKRTQALERFPANQRDTLDPLLRICFLPENSPYKNTMQATSEVVDALVETGIFKRSKRIFKDVFYRPVNAIDYQSEKGAAFLKDKQPPENPIRREKDLGLPE